MESLLVAEAAKFIKNNAADVAELGEEVVLAIFRQSVVAVLPPIPKLADDASLGARAELEAILSARTRNMQLIAKAERENTARVQRVRGNVAIVAGTVAKSVLSVVAGFAVRTVLGV